MKLKQILFIFLFILVYIVPTISAAQPSIITQTSTPTQLSLAYPKILDTTINKSVKFHFHIFNSSGIPINNSDCGFHLYDPVGNHIIENNDLPLDSNGMEFTANIGGGNFSMLGRYTWISWCNISVEGGFISSSIDVVDNNSIEFINTPDTYDSSASVAVIIFVMFIAFGLIMLPFAKENFVKFNNKYIQDMINLILRRACWVIGLFLMMFNSSIVATIAVDVGLNVTTEIYRYMYFLGWAGYIFLGFMFFSTLIKVMELWKLNLNNKKYGDDD